MHAQRDSPGSACDADSTVFGPTIRNTDIVVCCWLQRTVQVDTEINEDDCDDYG